MSELIWTKFTIDKGRLWVSKRVMETHVPFMPLYMNRAVCFITNWLWQMAWVIGRSERHTPSKIRWVTDVCFCMKRINWQSLRFRLLFRFCLLSSLHEYTKKQWIQSRELLPAKSTFSVLCVVDDVRESGTKNNTILISKHANCKTKFCSNFQIR